MKNRNGKKANILLLGKTGVGKSAFINYLIEEKRAETKPGRSTTQAFNVYEYSLKNGFNMAIYDSKGVEATENKEITHEVENFLLEKYGSNRVYEWIHAIFYCISLKRTRIEKSEIDFIKRIQEISLQKISIVITHCESIQEAGEMVELIKQELGENTPIYPISSISEKKKVGKEIHEYGRDEFIKNIKETVWRETAKRIVTEYAKKNREEIFKEIERFKKDNCCKIDRIRILQNKELTISWSLYNNHIKERISALNEVIADQIEELIKIYCPVANASSKYNILKEIEEYCKEKEYFTKDKWKSFSERLIKIRHQNEYNTLLKKLLNKSVYQISLKNCINTIGNELEEMVTSEEKIEENIGIVLSIEKEKSLEHTPIVKLKNKIGPNELCPCGSGKKYKNCCKDTGKYEW